MSATTLTLVDGAAVSTSAALADVNQVDLYAVSLKAGDGVFADLGAQNGNSPGDALRVFDANGKQLAFEENQPGGFDTTLTFNAVATGTYYIGVSSNGDYAYDPTNLGSGGGGLAAGGYSLSLTLTAGAIRTMESPGNDGVATAQTIVVNPLTSVIGQGVVEGQYAINQTEYYRFAVSETGGLTASVTSGEATAFPPRLALYSNTGQLLIQSGVGATAQLNQNLQPGIYYLGVSTAAASANPPADAAYDLATMFTPALPPSQPLTLASGVDSSGLATADFNHDGNLDLVATDTRDGGVLVALGNGDGTFQPAGFASVTDANGIGVGPYAVTTADLAGDGNMDIVTVDQNYDPTTNTFGQGAVSVLLGYGDGTFQNAVTYSVGFDPISVTTAEIGGRTDIITANSNYDPATQTYGQGTVSVLVGNGDGTFQAAQTYDVGLGPRSVAVTEIDGHMDIVTANQEDATVSVLLGNDDGTFNPTAETFNVGTGPESVAVGDIGGRTGIVTANYTDGTVSVLLDNGAGSFVQEGGPYKVGVQPVSVALEKFNGQTDIVTANSYSNSVSVLLGSADGTFQPAVSYAVGFSPRALTVGDFNNDGRLDIAVANESDYTVSLLFGQGGGAFASAPGLTVGQTPFGLATADFNNDGNMDLVTANGGDNTVSVLLGNGDGTFQPQLTYAVGNNPTFVAVGDFNGDGNPDIVTSNYVAGTVSVLLGLGDGTFRPQVTYTVGKEPQGVAVGDFTGDGNLDIVTANLGSDSVSVLLGNGDGTFDPTAETYQLPAGSKPYAIAVGNFNGHLGIVTADKGDGMVSVLLGNGDGTFDPTAENFRVGKGPRGDGGGLQRERRHCRRQRRRRHDVGADGRRQGRVRAAGRLPRRLPTYRRGGGGSCPGRPSRHRRRQRLGQHRVRVAERGRRHVPPRRDRADGRPPAGPGRGRLQQRRQHGRGHHQHREQHGVGAAGKGQRPLPNANLLPDRDRPPGHRLRHGQQQQRRHRRREPRPRPDTKRQRIGVVGLRGRQHFPVARRVVPGGKRPRRRGGDEQR